MSRNDYVVMQLSGSTHAAYQCKLTNPAACAAEPVDHARR